MRSARATAVAEAAIDLLATVGVRGLTHRAVDEVAALPSGSTSNVARTRSALLELSLTRLEELDRDAVTTDTPDPADLEALAGFLAAGLRVLTGERARLSAARYELALEANRRPRLREIYDKLGQRSRRGAVELMTAAGSTSPDRHGTMLVAYLDGIVFDVVVGAGSRPDPESLRLSLRELLRGMLGR